MDINRSNLTNLTTGYKVLFNLAFNDAPSVIDQIATTVPSSSKKQAYPWLGQTTGFREWVGDRVLQNLTKHGYSIDNRRFENTVTVDRDDIEDDQYGVYNPLMSQMGMDAKVHPDQLVFETLRNGHDTECYDGQAFFDTDHPVRSPGGAETSVSNFVDGGGPTWYLIETSRMIKPLIFQKRREYNFLAKINLNDDNVFFENKFVYGVDGRCAAGFGLWQQAFASRAPLTAENYQAARVAMTSMKNDNGRPMNIMPDLLILPPGLEAQGKKILLADKDSYGATNIYANTAKLLVTAWLG